MKNLRAIRKARGLSGAMLAGQLGIDPRRLRRYEAAATKPEKASRPGPDLAAQIVRRLGVTLGQLEGLEPVDLDALPMPIADEFASA